MQFRNSPKVGQRFSSIEPKRARQPRRKPIERAARHAIEALEDRVLLAVVNSLVDPLTGAGVDASKWSITTRGLETNANANYNAPTEDANGLVLGGTTAVSYWAGDSLESIDQFSSQTSTTVSVDRVSLTGIGSAYRSSLWILQPGGKYVHFSQNVGETGWSYNANLTGTTQGTGSGIAIGQFNNTAGQNEHLMKLLYTPGTGTNADIGIYLDGNLGATVHFTDWDHTVPFEAILTGQGRAAGDSVSAVFKNFSGVSDPIPTDPPLAPTSLTATAPAHALAVNLSWLDNANNEINYRLERSTDGTNFTEVATVPAVTGSGTTATYTDVAPAAGTKFYYRVRAFNTANGGSYSAYTNISNATTPPALTTLTDPLTGNGVDTTKWNVTNRGLENNGPAGYTAAEDATGLTLSGTATSQYWYGASLESKDVFRSEYQTTISVDRTALTGTGSAWRSSLWIFQPTAGGQFLQYAQDVNETGWEFNQTTNGGGTSIAAFDPLDTDGGDHIMKLVYTPLGGTNAKVDVYLDNVLGTTVNFTNWDNTIPFQVFLTGQARAATDTVSAQFTNFSATAVVPVSIPPTHLVAQKGAAGGVDLSFTDNATGELYYLLERSTDGTNFTSVANIPSADGAGSTILYHDASAGTGTYFYRVSEFSYATPNFSAPSNIAAVTVPPPTVSVPIITSLVDPLTEDTLDTTKWTETKRGLENTGDVGISSFITPSGLFFNGTAGNQYWYGDSIESNGEFSSGSQTTVQVERVFLSGTGLAGGTGNWRSSLWILQDNGQFLHFAQDFGETGWEYNQTAGNIGTAIDSFNTAAPDPSTDHIMKLVYTPLGGTNATVDMYLDGVLGATATFTNWDNSVPFKVILSGMARATGDSVETEFANVSASVTGPAPIVLSGTGNADNFYIKQNADGINDDVWINSATPGVGAPTTQFLLSQLSTVEIDGLGGNDILTADYTNGSPIPLTGLKFAGGAGTDTLKVIGTGGGDAFGVGSGGLSHAGGGTLSQSDVENLAIAGGNFAVDVQALTSGNVSSLDVGIGGTVRLVYPDAPAGDPNTAILVATIKSLLASGRNGGAWNGPGISSADAHTHANTALGYSNANDIFTIKYTLAGDVDLDGAVGFTDLVAVAQNYGRSDSTVDWAHGDVTYDGAVSFPDLVAVAQTYGLSLAASLPASTPAASAAVAAAPASAPVAAAAPAPVAVVPVVAPVTVTPVKAPAKPPAVVVGKTTVATPPTPVQITVAPTPVAKPAPVTTPFAVKTSLQTLSRRETSSADVLGKQSSASTSLFR